MLAFFTPFITADIDFLYGFVFAGCNLFAAFLVYFFLMESSGRTLEEVDFMYITGVPVRESSKYDIKAGGELVNSDKLFLEKGARGIRKRNEGGMGGAEHEEGVMVADSGEKEINAYSSGAAHHV